MQSSSFENFIKAYQDASTATRNFIDSEEIGLFIESLISKGFLVMEQKQSMLVAISNLCLKIIDKNQLGTLLIQAGIPFENAHQIHLEIISFLTHKGFDLDNHSMMSETLQPKIIPISVTPPINQNLASEIATAEHELVALQTVRTMSQDMSAIKPGSDVVYQSNQEDILARYNIPQPEVVSAGTEPPRWDSDSAK
jgi:hypothetical protein